MATLKPSDLHILNLAEYPHITESDLFKVIKYLPKMNERGPWIAGGSVWRTVNNESLDKCDIDMFFRDYKQYEETYRKMNSYPFVNNIIDEKKSKSNTTFKVHINEGKYNKTIDIHLIGMNYESSLYRLLSKFDFTVCQFGYNGNHIVYFDKSLKDLKSKILSLVRISYPKPFLRHLEKYLNNGFSMPTEELKMMTETLLRMDVWNKNASGTYDEKLKMLESDDLLTGVGVAQPRLTRGAYTRRNRPAVNTTVGVIEEEMPEPMPTPTMTVYEHTPYVQYTQPITQYQQTQAVNQNQNVYNEINLGGDIERTDYTQYTQPTANVTPTNTIATETLYDIVNEARLHRNDQLLNTENEEWAGYNYVLPMRQLRDPVEVRRDDTVLDTADEDWDEYNHNHRNVLTPEIVDPVRMLTLVQTHHQQEENERRNDQTI